MTGSPRAASRPPGPAALERSRWGVALAGAVLVAAVFAAYANSLSGPFVYDDKDSIVNNLTLRHLWPLTDVLAPLPGGLTVSGRPVLNLSLALNYALGGLDVRGYHAVNILIHALAGLTLFGLVRRILCLWPGKGPSTVGRVIPNPPNQPPSDRDRRVTDNAPDLARPFTDIPVADAALIAFTVAALWALHPMQTEAITYLVQRAESLMGLFYLLTLYCFVRAAGDAKDQGTQGPRDQETTAVQSPLVPWSFGPLVRRPWVWYALSVAACLLGMATKENMVSAPALVLILDRTFMAGSFAAVWRQRRRYYAALLATWVLLAGLLVSTGGNRGGSAGLGVDITWWAYVLTQFPALGHYLRLSLWPAPLVFDYGTFWIGSLAEVWPQACVAAALVVGTLYGLWRKPALGLAGAWFCAQLAPTSLVPGMTQRIVEHRMYLALAALAALGVAAVWQSAGRRGLAAFCALAAGLGVLTSQRNGDYRSEVSIWADTAAKRPANAGAHSSLGAALADAGRTAEAIREDEIALRLRPNFIAARNNLGTALIAAGRIDEAMRQLDESLRQQPDDAQAHLNMGVALDLLKRTAEAIPHYEAALRRDPSLAQAHNNLGDALSRSGQQAEGIAHLQEALRLKPGYLDAHYNLAAALARSGRLTEAQAEFAASLRLKPSDPEAYANWGGVLLATGHPAEAVLQYETALRLSPASAANHYNLGNALAAAGRLEDAVREFEAALRLQPDYVDAHNNLGNALTLLHREAEALPHYEAALTLQPNHASAHNNLGLALARLGRLEEAEAQFAQAVRLAPDYRQARDNLARAQAQLRGAAP